MPAHYIAPRTPDAWFKAGHEVFEEFLATLAGDGVTPDPDLRLVAGESANPYYEHESKTVVLGMPDPATARGRMHWIFLARLVGATGVEEAIATVGYQLPLLVAHEVTHHLRHHYGAPTLNNFVEEQVANTVAVAFVREHARFRGTLAKVHEQALAVEQKLEGLTPETDPYLSGFRLDLGDVLAAQGKLDQAELDRLRRLADALAEPLEGVLADAGVVSRADMRRAAARIERSEAYFNRRYMAKLPEYLAFFREWFEAYLLRDDFPSLAEALEQHILTADWEEARRHDVSLLLAAALRDPSDEIAAAAAEALAHEDGSAAVGPLLGALEDGRPSLRAAVLTALSGLGAPSAEVVRAARSALGSADAHVRAAAAGVLLAASGSDRQRARAVLEALLAEGAPQRTAALRALARTADTAFTSSLVACVHSRDPEQRALALDCLSRLPALEAIGELASLALRDRDDRVRRAAVRCLGTHAGATTLPRLVAALADPADPVHEEAAVALLARGSSVCAALAGCAGPWRARARAALLGRQLEDRGASRRIRRLVDELAERSRELAAVMASLPGDAERQRIIREALWEKRREIGRLTLALVGELEARPAAALALRGLAAHDAAVRDTAEELASDIVGPELAEVLSPLLEDEGPPISDGAEHGPLDRVFDYPEPFLRELAAEYLATASRRPYGLAERGAVLTTIEKLMLLRAVPLFADVALEDLRPLAEDFLVETYAKGDRVFEAGELPRALYVIAAGEVGIQQTRPGGQAERIATLGPRQPFGEMALLGGRKHSRSAVALMDTTLLALGRDAFLGLSMRHPQILMAIIRVLGDRLARANALLRAASADE